MYSNIVNPKTGRRVSVKSMLGKNILRNYLLILSGGAARDAILAKIINANKTKEVAKALKEASPSMRANRDVVLAAVVRNGWALEHADDTLKVDRGVVLAAVTQNPYALEFAADTLKADKGVVLVAVAGSGTALEYAADTLKADTDVVLAAVTRLAIDGDPSSTVLDLVDSTFVHNSLSLHTDLKNLRWPHQGLSDDKIQFLRKINEVRKSKHVADELMRASPTLKADKRVVLIAVAKSGWALEHAPALKADKGVVLAAVTRDPGALVYAASTLQHDPEVLRAAGDEDGAVRVEKEAETKWVAVGTKYRVGQKVIYDTTPPSGGGGFVAEGVIEDTPHTSTGQYLIKSINGSKFLVDEIDIQLIPLSESDRATRGLMMALGTRVPDDSTGMAVTDMGSGSRGLRQVVNSHGVMRKIFQYAKQTLDLTICANTLVGHSGGVRSVAVLKDGRIVSASDDNTMKVWKESSPLSGAWNLEATLEYADQARSPATGRPWEEGEGVMCVSVLPDQHLVSGYADTIGGMGTIRVWGEHSTQGWGVEDELPGEFARSMAVLKDNRFVTGNEHNVVKVWREIVDRRFGGVDETSWSIDAILTENTDDAYGMVSCLAVLPDQRLVVGKDNDTVKVWRETSPRSWSVEATLDAGRVDLRRHHLDCLAVLPDGRIAGGSRNRRAPTPMVRVWTENAGGAAWSYSEDIYGRKGGFGSVMSLTALPDGSLFGGSGDNTVTMWTENPAAVEDGAAAEEGESCEPGGQRHLSCGDWTASVIGHPDGLILARSFDIATRPSWHQHSVDGVGVLPDGRLVSGSRDNTLKVWGVLNL